MRTSVNAAVSTKPVLFVVVPKSHSCLRDVCLVGEMARSVQLADRRPEDAEKILRASLVVPSERVSDLSAIGECVRLRSWLRKDHMDRRYRGSPAYLAAAQRFRTHPDSLPTLRDLEKIDSRTLARLAAQIEDDVARRSGEQEKQEFVIPSAPTPKVEVDLRGTLEVDPNYLHQIQLEMGRTLELPMVPQNTEGSPEVPMPPVVHRASFWVGLTVNSLVLASIWFFVSAV